MKENLIGAVVVSSLVFAAMGGVYLMGQSKGHATALKDMQHEAVANGYGEWQINTQHGYPYDDSIYFRWRSIDRKTGKVWNYKADE